MFIDITQIVSDPLWESLAIPYTCRLDSKHHTIRLTFSPSIVILNDFVHMADVFVPLLLYLSYLVRVPSLVGSEE